MKRDNPEDRIHRKAVAYLRKSFRKREGFEPEECPFFHCPNESRESMAWRAKMQRLGLSPGVPDLVFVWPMIREIPLCRGAALEIKAPRGRLDNKGRQQRWLDRWEAAGFATAVTRGHVATAHQLWAWGYLLEEHRDEWIAWAQTQDPKAA